MTRSRRPPELAALLAVAIMLVHGAAAADTAVTIERNGYQGHMEVVQVVDMSLVLVADLPPGAGSHVVSLPGGEYWLQVARNTDTRFPFGVDEDTATVSLLRPDEGAAAIIDGTTISLQGVSIDLMTSSYGGDWEVLQVASGRGAHVTTPIVLVKHLSFVIELARSTSARFSVVIGASGDVTVHPSGVADVAGSPGGGFDLTLQPVTITIDPSAYAGGWSVHGVTPLSSGPASVELVRDLGFAIIIGEHVPGGLFQLFISESGSVTTDNVSAAQAAGNTVTFNTETVSVDPGEAGTAWEFRTHAPSVGVDEVALPPGLEYRLERNNLIQLVEVDTPCAVAPQSFTLSGTDFRVRCGGLNGVYHVDSVLGDDAGDGSLAAPWRTLARVNALELFPGDTVLLKRGSVFRERLLVAPEEDGTPAAPIVVDAYGDGALPVISAGELVPQGAAWVEAALSPGVYRLPLGPTHAFYTCCPVLVRGAPAGIDTYAMLSRSFHPLGSDLQTSLNSLPENSYLTNIEFPDGRVLYHRPAPGTLPGDFEYEVSKRNTAVLVEGDDVEVHNVQAILGNVGNPTFDPPAVNGTIQASGAGVVFAGCVAAFGRSEGVVVRGADSRIDACVAEHNSSTGLYVLGPGAVRSVVSNSIARFNGNLEFEDLDRGGIGIQASDVVVRGNIVHNNGNVADLTPPRVAGDSAIGVASSDGSNPAATPANVRIENNFIFDSARSAIALPYGDGSFGHRIVGNVIYNWSLIGPACDGEPDDPNPPACRSAAIARSAIAVFGFGNTPESGVVDVMHNTIYSDQTHEWLYGIAALLPTNDDWLRDSRIVNNIVFMPDNTDPRTVGLRTTRSHRYENVQIDYNDVLVPLDGANNYEVLGFIGPDMAALGEPGFEQNSLNVDPGLDLAIANPADPARYDLLPGSPVIDAGIDAGVTADFLGRPVPAGAAPDIGAFEQPLTCADADLDGVCDDVDVCPAGALAVIGLEPPLDALAPEGDAPAAPDKAFKQNRTLPLRLSLACDGVVLGETDVGPPTISEVALQGGPLDLPTVDTDAGESNSGGLEFRFEDGAWIYNLSTRGLESGSYLVSVATPEGVRYTAAFVLR